MLDKVFGKKSKKSGDDDDLEFQLPDSHKVVNKKDGDNEDNDEDDTTNHVDDSEVNGDDGIDVNVDSDNPTVMKEQIKKLRNDVKDKDSTIEVQRDYITKKIQEARETIQAWKEENIKLNQQITELKAGGATAGGSDEKGGDDDEAGNDPEKLKNIISKLKADVKEQKTIVDKQKQYIETRNSQFKETIQSWKEETLRLKGELEKYEQKE